MPLPTDVIPDAEAIAVAWAKADGDLSPYLDNGDGSYRISTRVPENPSFPYLTVFRVGGVVGEDTEAPVDEALLQWDAYAVRGTKSPDYNTASQVARTLIHKARLFEGVVSHADGDAWVYAFDIFSGPRRLEEPETGWARYTVETTLVMRRS